MNVNELQILNQRRAETGRPALTHEQANELEFANPGQDLVDFHVAVSVIIPDYVDSKTYE